MIEQFAERRTIPVLRDRDDQFIHRLQNAPSVLPRTTALLPDVAGASERGPTHFLGQACTTRGEITIHDDLYAA